MDNPGRGPPAGTGCAQPELTSDEAHKVEKRAIGEELRLCAAYGQLILPIS